MQLRALDRTRWGVIGASIAGNSVNGLVASTVLSLALVPISQEFGWPRQLITGVGALLAPVNILLPIAIGWLADRIGPRRILLFGNAGFATSLALASLLSPNVYWFYADFFAIGILGWITGPLLFGKILAGWFDSARGTVIGFVAGTGNGLCTIVMPIVCAVLVSHYGWRGAYLGTAFIVFLVGFPAMALMLRDPPSDALSPELPAGVTPADDSATSLTLSEALRGPSYWLIAVAMTLGSGCMLAVMSHTVPALTDRGFPISRAIPVVTCISAIGMLAQIGVGMLLDRLRSPSLIAPLYASSVLGIHLIMTATTMPLLLCGGALLGLGVGTEFAALPVLLSRCFGVKHYGKIAGVTYSGIMVTGSLMPFALDWSFDATGSYSAAFDAMQIALVLGAGLICLLPPIGPAPRTAFPADSSTAKRDGAGPARTMPYADY